MKQEEKKFIEEAKTAKDIQRSGGQILRVDNYGGLNKTSPSINTPMTDSPEMLNMDVDISGALTKRKGSQIKRSGFSSCVGDITTYYSLPSGALLSFRKKGRDAEVDYLVSKGNLADNVNVRTYTDLWTEAARLVKPSYVWTTGFTDRLILCTGVNVPIEFFVQSTTAYGDGTSVVSIPGNRVSRFSVDTSRVMYGSDTSSPVVLTPNNISYDAVNDETDFTFSTTVPDAQQLDLVNVSWHWWAEAIKRTSFQLYDSTYRFNTSVAADANVQVPVEIKRSLQVDTTSFLEAGGNLAYGNKTCVVAQTNLAGTGYFTFVNPPTSDTEFAWSTGQFTTGGGADKCPPGTDFITFGGISGTGTSPPTPVNFVRYHYIPFNGNTGIVASNLTMVDNNSNLWTLNTGADANQTSSTRYYGLQKLDNTQVTLTTDVAWLWGTSRGFPLGLDSEFAILINSEPGDFVGSSANNIYYNGTVDGSYFPAYGLSEYCNYNIGDFPRCVGLVQDRIVLSGFPEFPMTVIMSNQGSRGSIFDYQNYQTLYDDPTIAYNPIEIVLDGDTNDKIVAFQTWYDSLFVFTENTVRRLFGDNTTATFTPSSINQSYITNVGCRSPLGTCRTDNAIFFISDSGFYKVIVNDTDGGYGAFNAGIKVEDLFIKNTEVNPSVAWCYYSRGRDLIYIGLTSDFDKELTSRVLVYFNKRDAFTEYAMYNGLMLTTHGEGIGNREFLIQVIRDGDVDTVPNALTSKYLEVEMNVLDFCIDRACSPDSVEFGWTSNFTYPEVQYDINTSQRIIPTLPHKQQSGEQIHGFKSLPLANFSDYYEVSYFNGVYETTLSFSNSDFNLYPFQDSIYINVLPYSGSGYIRIRLIDDLGNIPLKVFQDNVELAQETEYTAIQNGNLMFLELIKEYNANSVYYSGSVIPAWHFTPTMLEDVPVQFKRGLHYLGYYNNTPYHEFYSANDANTQANQSSSDLADQFKNKAAVKAGILYNDARSGTFDLEMYGTEDLTWDVSLFDLPSASYRNQLMDVVRLVAPMLGIGYSVQAVNFNFSNEVFEIIGYRTVTRLKGRNTTRWY